MAGPDVVAGRFALCDPLARGAAGTVWRAWDLRRGDWCAAKVMRQRDAGDLLRFAREQSLRLHHPHLLTPYSWAAEDAHVAIVSPLVAGGSLHTLLGDHGPLAPELVADLLDQLLDGLDYAHRSGIVHRDVTPANVLLEATGSGRPVLRLADFGLAVRIGEPRLTHLGTVLGTPGYVPPEVLAGAAPAPSADLYAAGRLALALLTGTETAPIGPGPLYDVVAVLIAPEPADRPATAADARRALGPVAPAQSPTTATGDPVTVLDQLPTLPPGWSPAGPPDAVADTPVDPELVARARAVFAASPPTSTPGPDPRPTPAPSPPAYAAPATPSWPADPIPEPTIRPSDGSPPEPSPPADAAPAAPSWPGGAVPAPVTGSSKEPAAGTGGPGEEPAPVGARRSWRWWSLLVGAITMALAVFAFGIVLMNGDVGDAPADGPSPTPSGVAVVSGPAAADGVCGWQQEGDAATDSAGRALRCVRTADGYRWQLS